MFSFLIFLTFPFFFSLLMMKYGVGLDFFFSTSVSRCFVSCFCRTPVLFLRMYMASDLTLELVVVLQMW